jgi:hypothetical protein
MVDDPSGDGSLPTPPSDNSQEEKEANDAQKAHEASCHDLFSKGMFSDFVNSCGNGKYAVVAVTTFIPHCEILGGLGKGDCHGLFEPGTYRTKEAVVVDLTTGKIIFQLEDASASETLFGTSKKPDREGKFGASASLDDDGNVSVRLSANIGSALLEWAGLTITYDFKVTLSQNDSSPIVTGTSDGFPAYQINVFRPTKTCGSGETLGITGEG